ncbi:MAG: hypothetical protein H6713_26975 [Myxococcales bacterium]|nr:tRNA(His) guanylyltransferase Thg1 family protein [Myxococcales bacterium]MCB9753602.1 hypothetical protein [Myxococcales bacterium]
MSKKLTFADRMKGYEHAEAGRRLMPLTPVIARLDGKGFSRFTASLERPFDRRLSELMIDMTIALVTETGARVGYTQSDELSLLWYSEDYQRQIYHDGRIQKMVSLLAARASVWFNAALPERIPEKAGRAPVFDCRVFPVPNKVEAANVLLWRERDATRNSLSMAARARYSHAQLHGKGHREMHDMLMAKGVNWNDYPAFFKRGTYVQACTVSRPFSADELESLPPKHAAHQNPELVVERRVIDRLELPPIGRVRNRVDVLFDGASPILEADARDELDDDDDDDEPRDA